MLTPVGNAPSARAGHAGPSEGSVLLGRYRIDSERGRTEAGSLYDAHETTTGRRVSVEIADGLGDVDARARVRFVRDAMLAQRLEGEHVLRVLDTGTLTDGTPFVVREVAVTNLADEIEARGPSTPDKAVEWTLEAAEAIAEAHALGMAHGDLHPGSVTLARGDDGRLCLKVAWTTATGARSGEDETDDVARDIAGLGLLLRALVTGTLSTADDEELDEGGAKTLPNGIAHAVARATATGLARYANVGELVDDLAPLAPPGHAAARNVAFMLSRAGLATPLPRAPSPSQRLAAESTPLSPPAPLPPRPIATLGRPGQALGIPHELRERHEPQQAAPHPSDHPAQPVPWLGAPHDRDGLGDAAAWQEPRLRRRLVLAALVTLLVLGALLGILTLARARMLPPWTGAGTALEETEPTESAGPETRALAERVGLDAVWSGARVPPPGTARAERERGGAAATESPDGQGTEQLMEHEGSPPSESRGRAGPSGSGEISPLGPPRSAAEAEQRSRGREHDHGAGSHAPGDPGGPAPALPSPAAPTAPAETREPLDLGPPGYPDRGTDI